jgi:hypothetical protein
MDASVLSKGIGDGDFHASLISKKTAPLLPWTKKFFCRVCLNYPASNKSKQIQMPSILGGPGVIEG